MFRAFHLKKKILFYLISDFRNTFNDEMKKVKGDIINVYFYSYTQNILFMV